MPAHATNRTLTATPENPAAMSPMNLWPLARHALAALCLTACWSGVQAAPLSVDSVTPLGDVVLNTGLTAGQLSTAFVDASDPGASEAGGLGGSALDIFSLEAALGLATAADTLEGSGLQWRFMGQAGQQLRLRWQLDTVGFDPAFADRAYLWLNGLSIGEFTVDALSQTGILQVALASSGQHTLSAAVVDVNDVTGVSTFTVDQLSLVPEPGSLALSALALAALLGSAARRQPQRPR